ncbi:MAG: MFS transporter [Thermoplasmata archaeon]|nr:MAG: MFS transporter [Thermoplasmata archaeon]
MKYKWVVMAAFWLLIFSYGANWFSVAPILHEIESKYNVGHTYSHLLLSVIGLFVVFFAWPAGHLVDKKGAKASALVGSIFMFIGFGSRAFLLQSYWELLTATIIAGFGLAWILVALAPMMIQWFEEKASLAIGITSSGLFLGFSFGSAASPYIFDQYGFDAVFKFFALLSFIAFLIWAIAGKDRRKIESRRISFKEGIKQIMASKNALLYPLIGFFIVGATLSASALMPSMHEFSDIQRGVIISVMLLGCAIGAFSFPYIAAKHGIKKIASSVAILAFLLWIAFYYIHSYAALLAISFLFGVFLQAGWPIALHSQETEKGVTKENEGIASSLFISISNVGGAVLPVLTGYLEKSIAMAFAGIAAYILACFILWLAVRK